MVDWVKKVNKACSEELGGEQLLGALFTQPAGALASSIGMGVGGVIGSMVGRSMSKDGSSTEGTAAEIPGKNAVLALTADRFIVFGHSALSGKPKGVVLEIPVGDVVDMALEDGKVNAKLAVAFADETVKVFDAPKLGKPGEFLAAYEQLKSA